MKVLVVGGGGREHALAWKLADSPRVSQVFVAPGNAGTGLEPGVCNIEIGVDDLSGLRDFARDNQVGLTIVGPEAPLVGGIVDLFAEAGLRCLGPRRDAAMLEGSKDFCKQFLRRHAIPTADFRTFSDVAAARRYLNEHPLPVVIKADGLAAGKGVVIAATRQQALDAIDDMLSANRFGEAGSRVVIEEFLQGEEASFIVVADGRNCLPMATSQDHKPRDEGDQGPNTGGMGAYSPAPVVTPQVYRRIMDEVIHPTIAGMAAEGLPYTGFLYAGLMIAADGTPRVLEYNCRFGDPETQPVLMRLNSDFLDICEAAVEENLDSVSAQWNPGPALGVVMAAGGYPGACRSGDIIRGLGACLPDHSKVFHAGTRCEDGEVVTAGGRVLCACATGDSVAEAKARAYRLAGTIDWSDVYYRGDIGFRALARESDG